MIRDPLRPPETDDEPPDPRAWSRNATVAAFLLIAAMVAVLDTSPDSSPDKASPACGPASRSAMRPGAACSGTPASAARARRSAGDRAR